MKQIKKKSPDNYLPYIIISNDVLKLSSLGCGSCWRLLRPPHLSAEFLKYIMMVLPISSSVVVKLVELSITFFTIEQILVFLNPILYSLFFVFQPMRPSQLNLVCISFVKIVSTMYFTDVFTLVPPRRRRLQCTALSREGSESRFSLSCSNSSSVQTGKSGLIAGKSSVFDRASRFLMLFNL